MQASNRRPSKQYGGKSITLGLTLIGHDVSYTIVDEDGTPLIIAEEERYSRRKRGTYVPSPRQLLEVLAETGVPRESVRNIAICNIPELVEQRLPETWSVPHLPYGRALSSAALVRAISTLVPDLDSVTWVRHHLCHAASAYLPSPFEEAAVITVDGMGEDETATIWLGKGRHLLKRLAVLHPHSLGCVYDATAQWMGLTGGEREGKLMGLASFGRPSLQHVFGEHFIQSDAREGLVAAEALVNRSCDSNSWVAYCEHFLGPQRSPDEELTQYHKDIASSLQSHVEEVLLDLMRLAARLTGARYCCLAGGVFMNSMANGRIRREGPFEDVWVQPMASDNGLSLGAALWVHTRLHSEQPRWRMSTPFLGSEITEGQISELLNQHGIEVKPSLCVEREVAELLAEGKLVGWIQGRSEVGARALGHRSIFADPRNPNMKDVINQRIKEREDWRPFAPMVLEEDAARFFVDPRSSPFMMFVTPAVPGAPIPAALHVDNTARVQTVTRAFDPMLHRLLCAFKELTGIGVLVNTSFNTRGEPIVRTADDAYRVFTGTGMDVLVLGDYILRKPEGFNWEGTPIGPPPPRIQVSDKLVRVLEGHQRISIISLGSSDFASVVEQVIRNGAAKASDVSVYLPRDRGKMAHPITLSEFCTPTGEAVSLQDVYSRGVMVLLLPTWIEVAADLVPNLLRPFVPLAKKEPQTPILLVDEASGLTSIQEMLQSGTLECTLDGASEVEHSWLMSH